METKLDVSNAKEYLGRKITDAEKVLRLIGKGKKMPLATVKERKMSYLGKISREKGNTDY